MFPEESVKIGGADEGRRAYGTVVERLTQMKVYVIERADQRRRVMLVNRRNILLATIVNPAKDL